MLAVSDPSAAIEFYQRAFGARVRWQIGDPADVAELAVEGADFFLAREQAKNPRSPDSGGFTTCRIELFVDDPVAVQARAVGAGAMARGSVDLHEHSLSSPVGETLRMLQGGVTDPFGHIWLIGKFL